MQEKTIDASVSRQRLVGILLFNDMDVLDFAGPFEVFSTTYNPNGEHAFKVVTISQEGHAVLSSYGLTVIPCYSFATCPRLDILVVPGGKGARDRQLFNPSLLQWILRQSSQAEYTASVCTGAFILAQAGLLNGKNATTHAQHINPLALIYPHVTVFKNCRFVESGRIITSAGVSAGIDMSLHIIKKLCGEDAAMQTAKNMEYASPS